MRHLNFIVHKRGKSYEKERCIFHGNSEKQLHKFPQTKLEKIVYSLVQLQHGMKASLKTKPLHGLGDGVMEFVQNGKPAYRCVYVVLDDVIHVLHAFVKTSDGTDSKHENTIKERYKNIKKG
ncbi:type II toxin-antitoxin system RelE/ParE family toxin [Aeromonas rivipollensis]|uniref:type II toxin-antitoxin system RelE/ParE family toxin n=2 Tax=Gammaproteobacteria TaxID=1236 RepID=UPI00399CE8F3